MIPYLSDNAWSQGDNVDGKTGGFALRFAAMAGAESGSPKAGEFLLNFLQTNHVRSPTYAPQENYPMNPGRGFAALALGRMLAKPTSSGFAEHDRLRGNIVRSMVDIAQDRKEPYNLRAACLLGLGLSGDPRLVPEVKSATDSTDGRDAFVAAYAVLSLAMLGDEDAVILAEKLLKEVPAVSWTGPGQWRSIADQRAIFRQMVRRPVYIALVFSGSYQAVAALEKPQLHSTDDLDWLRALRLSGSGSDVVSGLISEFDAADQSSQTTDRVIYAIGEVLAENPLKLHRLVLAHCNPTAPMFEKGQSNFDEKSEGVWLRVIADPFLQGNYAPLRRGYRH